MTEAAAAAAVVGNVVVTELLLLVVMVVVVAAVSLTGVVTAKPPLFLRVGCGGGGCGWQTTVRPPARVCLPASFNFPKVTPFR